MSWSVKFIPQAERELRKLDKPVRKRITGFLKEVSTLGDPRLRGKALTGNWAGFWRWRVGDYRVVATLENNDLIILVVSIGHRSSVYKRSQLRDY